MPERLSVNKLALRIVEDLIENDDYYRVSVDELPCGAKLIDTGLEAPGGIEAGLRLTEICLGGLGKAQLTYVAYSPDLCLPAVAVSTDHPAISLIGCQLAGWMVKVGDFFAPSSGPARALAQKPRKVFERIGYRDEYDAAIIVMEANRRPTDEVALQVAKDCGVKPWNLFILLTTTASIAGSIQVAGRVAETGLYRLEHLGLDPKKVLYAAGVAPIMPPHPDVGVSTAREEDSLLYGGSATYVIDEEESKLAEIARSAPASAWPGYGKLSYEALKEVGFDWSKLDPSFFAIGHICIICKRTGRAFSAGSINPQALRRSIEFMP